MTQRTTHTAWSAVNHTHKWTDTSVPHTKLFRVISFSVCPQYAISHTVVAVVVVSHETMKNTSNDDDYLYHKLDLKCSTEYRVHTRRHVWVCDVRESSCFRKLLSYLQLIVDCNYFTTSFHWNLKFGMSVWVRCSTCIVYVISLLIVIISANRIEKVQSASIQSHSHLSAAITHSFRLELERNNFFQTLCIVRAVRTRRIYALAPPIDSFFLSIFIKWLMLTHTRHTHAQLGWNLILIFLFSF